MPHEANVEALAALLFRVEHIELGITPPFELLPRARQDVFRRRAVFLSNRGVLAADAVAADLARALGLADADRAADRLRAQMEGVARGDAAPEATARGGEEPGG